MPGTNPFDLTGRVAVVTGGYGVLGSRMAEALAGAGAKVAVLGRRPEAAAACAEALCRTGAEAIPLIADVLDEAALRRACDALLDAWGRVDILINAAGGNVARARTDDVPVFTLPFDAFDEVVRLNLHGTVYPTLIFGEAMARQGTGSIVNISSMASFQALSGVMGYSAAKAAIDNFTRWMAVDLARRHGEGLRVNAIAPGFFITRQNRDVLLNPDGSYTERTQKVIAKTPMGRLGRPEELQGPVLWLCSDAASFVTGAVIPVDGGFSAFSGL
ncbi:SDR family oxidoreductase [Rhodocaloribacter litoris]|uniref:SDR family oxidoreductase n=1 Tax=Rhodocaloribacter litoris TaxID=2558931 RepID=UPI0014203B82|nr:SDR family oxidoreductase [Rhodocaloribacter litoris]QXD14807.1 SDR family oxidoreductase [Rhodocaloribacter litoris]GIV59102.1 MAG: dioxygenase [Rhodothermaceae bacterium]